MRSALHEQMRDEKIVLADPRGRLDPSSIRAAVVHTWQHIAVAVPRAALAGEQACHVALLAHNVCERDKCRLRLLQLCHCCKDLWDLRFLYLLASKTSQSAAILDEADRSHAVLQLCSLSAPVWPRSQPSSQAILSQHQEPGNTPSRNGHARPSRAWHHFLAGRRQLIRYVTTSWHHMKHPDLFPVDPVRDISTSLPCDQVPFYQTLPQCRRT